MAPCTEYKYGENVLSRSASGNSLLFPLVVLSVCYHGVIVVRSRAFKKQDTSSIQTPENDRGRQLCRFAAIFIHFVDWGFGIGWDNLMCGVQIWLASLLSHGHGNIGNDQCSTTSTIT